MPDAGRIATMHTGLQVSDMDASLRFYSGLLGFDLVVDVVSGGWLAEVRSGQTQAQVRICVVRCGSQTIELLQWIPAVSAPSPPSAAPGVAHLAFRVDDVTSLHRRLTAAGVEFLFPPREAIPGEPMTFALDPDGVLIELIQIGPDGPGAQGVFG